MDIQAPLQPKGYAVEYLSVEANQAFRPSGKKVKTQLRFGMSPKLMQKRGTNQYMLRIEVGFNEKPEDFKVAPYRIVIKLATFFELDPDVPEAQRKQLLSLNLISIAYGIARGVVSQVTAQGPHGKFLLPAVNLVEILKQFKK